MKNKMCVVIILLLIVVVFLNTNVYASYSISDIFTDAETLTGSEDAVGTMISTPAMKKTSNFLYKLFYAIGMVAAVTVGIILGIQFMLASAGEKAKIKEALIAYVVGCTVLFGAYKIWNRVTKIMKETASTEEITTEQGESGFQNDGQGNQGEQEEQKKQIESGRFSYYYHVKNKTVLSQLTEKGYYDNKGTILEMGFVIDIPDWSLIKDLDKIPLIIKLHGGGGFSNEYLLNSFIDDTRFGQKELPAIVLYPCKTSSTNVAWKKYNDAVIGIIDWVIKEYNIDQNKISLAGFSRGGGRRLANSSNES